MTDQARDENPTWRPEVAQSIRRDIVKTFEAYVSDLEVYELRTELVRAGAVLCDAIGLTEEDFLLEALQIFRGVARASAERRAAQASSSSAVPS